MRRSFILAKGDPLRRSRYCIAFAVMATWALLTTALAPQAFADPGDGVEVAFSDGVTCSLDASWPHYSRDHGDVSAAATVTCIGGSATARLKTLIQGPTENDHAPIIKVCEETRTTRHQGSNVYFVKHPCHAGSYPGDGLYYSHVTASITHGGETESAYDFARMTATRR